MTGTRVAEIEFRIRPATAADIEAVDALLSRAYPLLLKEDYPPSVRVTAIPLLARAQPGLVTCGTYYVADAGTSGIVGAGGWTSHDPFSGAASGSRSGHVRHFATDPGFLRQGVARRLLAQSVEEARVAGLVAFNCYATRSAVPFYQSQGFTVIDERSFVLRPGIAFPAVRMRRPLT